MNDSNPLPADHPQSLTSDIKVRYPRLAALLEAHPEIINGGFQAQATNILKANSSLKSKSKKLFQLTDLLNTSIEKYATCQKGCAHCCYMPTMIYAHEAEIVGHAAGIKPEPLPYRDPSVVLAEAIKQFGPPCPFLSHENSCTVYEHRPLICRLHHSFNDDPNDCKVSESGTKTSIAKINPDQIEVPYHMLVLEHTPKEPWGTIQMFFPKL